MGYTPGGGDWDRSIDDAIYDCGKFLIVLSPNSVESSEVRAELRTALDEKKPIIPVVQSACRMPRQLRTIQYVDFSSRGPNDEAALKQLLRTLATASERVAPQESQAAEITKKESAQAERHSKALASGAVFRDGLSDGSQGPEMVVIPPGEFRMGGSHTVHISKPFALGKHQVIFDEYDALVKATKQRLPNDQGWGRGRRPVINVSWECEMALRANRQALSSAK
jgi:hypothetical protein